MVAHAFNTSIQEAETGRSLRVQGQPGQQSEFQNNQGDTEKPYLKKKRKEKVCLNDFVFGFQCYKKKGSMKTDDYILYSYMAHTTRNTICGQIYSLLIPYGISFRNQMAKLSCRQKVCFSHSSASENIRCLSHKQTPRIQNLEELHFA